MELGNVLTFGLFRVSNETPTITTIATTGHFVWGEGLEKGASRPQVPTGLSWSMVLEYSEICWWISQHYYFVET